MSTIRKHYGKWQCLVRVKDHPQIIKSFTLREDAKRWGNETKLKIRREDAGIAKIKFPSFRDISLRYLNEVSIYKKCHRDERYTINSLAREAWSEYPIHKITPLIIGKYRDKQRELLETYENLISYEKEDKNDKVKSKRNGLVHKRAKNSN